MARPTARLTRAFFRARLFTARLTRARFTARFFTARLTTAFFTARLATALLARFRTFASLWFSRSSRERPRGRHHMSGWLDNSKPRRAKVRLLSVPRDM